MCKKEDNYTILQPKSRINRNKIILVVNDFNNNSLFDFYNKKYNRYVK